KSILDALLSQTKKLNKRLSRSDQQKIMQFQQAVRESEKKILKMESWSRIPRPKVNEPMPKTFSKDSTSLETAPALLDIAKLALVTDSTRLITLMVEGNSWHNKTHHGKREKALQELASYEEAQMSMLNSFLHDLKNHQEDDASLLDRTAVLYGTNMGDANRHSNDNLPTLIAGGAFKHKGHLKFDLQKNYSLSNLHLSILHMLGINKDQFSSSTGTMRGLEIG
ncbi:MAG: DUF1552 domain-containing protein, partial [Lentisphaeraceae bacterium]|nr:DUF1552 domain-containing protein [Lentisphaeraceae bacterium]